MLSLRRVLITVRNSQLQSVRTRHTATFQLARGCKSSAARLILNVPPRTPCNNYIGCPLKQGSLTNCVYSCTVLPVELHRFVSQNSVSRVLISYTSLICIPRWLCCTKLQPSLQCRTVHFLPPHHLPGTVYLHTFVALPLLHCSSYLDSRLTSSLYHLLSLVTIGLFWHGCGCEISSKRLKISIEHSRRSFYRAANAIFGRIGRIATEEVVLHLLLTNPNACLSCYMALKPAQ